MAIIRVIAEGVGPFDRLDLDLSDGHGNPHLGPHILAGVNGSGKSTALRAIAWALDRGQHGFPFKLWGHALAGHPSPLTFLELRAPVFATQHVLGCTTEQRPHTKTRLAEVVQEHFGSFGFHWTNVRSDRPGQDYACLERGGPIENLVEFAAYGPSRQLRYVELPDLSKTATHPAPDSLAFEATVQNEAVQAWLLSTFSKRAIARERRQPTKIYERLLERFESALKLIHHEDISLDVALDPVFQIRLRLRGRSLNFAQLPDGVLSTVAWLADFLMRLDLASWRPELKGKRPGILLLDEVDAHLHPIWQRRLLPAMREALPDVQIIVTSHSPFVISSCPGSRVHVLELDDHGRARAHPPVDAPVGESITTTLKGIFGVNSRFDIKTSDELEEWNRLKREEAVGKLSSTDRSRLHGLTKMLSDRSEDLRSIVGGSTGLPDDTVRVLVKGKGPDSPRRGRRRRTGTAG